MNKEKNTESSRKRFELLLSLISLAISVIALYLSIQAQQSVSSPNVELINSEAHAETPASEMLGKIVLRNYGHANTMLVGLRIEAFPYNDTNPNYIHFLIADDEAKLTTEEANLRMILGLFPGENLLSRIDSRTILSGQTETLYFRLNPIINLGNGDIRLTQNILIRLLFNNGEEIVVLPEIK